MQWKAPAYRVLWAVLGIATLLIAAGAEAHWG
jgi:hypothetical protein